MGCFLSKHALARRFLWADCLNKSPLSTTHVTWRDFRNDTSGHHLAETRPGAPGLRKKLRTGIPLRSRHNILCKSVVMSAIKHIRPLVISLCLVVISGCDPLFVYSPYETALDEAYHNTNQKNLDRIRSLNTNESKSFKIALLSDAHYHFSKLNDALVHINQSNEFDFAIVLGDLTDNGLLREYVFFHESMSLLKIPHLAVIGNHDYLSNGGEVYHQMYGPGNFTFVYNNVKFVLFDNIRWESNKVPDFGWLEGALVNDHGYDHVIPLSHIPPYDGQMKEYADRFHSLLVGNNIMTSFHGHRHEFSIEDYLGDGVSYVTVSSPQYRVYTALTVSPEGIGIEKIEF
jgi:3',5'-cyclic-AMP phosphodiesterase